MDKFVARANIKNFKTLLETETDPLVRKILLTLLADEEEKLSIALQHKRKEG